MRDKDGSALMFMWLFICLVWGLLIAASPSNALQIEFDYSYDKDQFFTQEYKNVLETAAGYYQGFNDHLTEINTGDTGNWQVTVQNPSSPFGSVTLSNLVVAENTIKVFVGSSSTQVPALAMASTGVISADDSVAQTVIDRGQGVTTGDTAMDYATWGGSVWFNSAVAWSLDPEGPSADSHDLLTTAIHELAHLLGFGSSASWVNQTESQEGALYFLGDNAVALNGEPVPLDSYGSHWAEGLESYVQGAPQETLLDPSTLKGERQLLTALDMAGLQDIGWQVVEVPVPSAFWLFGSSLLGILLSRYRHLLNSRDLSPQVFA